MYLGIDIGGTNGRVVAYQDLDNLDRIVGRRNFTVSETFSTDIERLIGACLELRDEAGGLSGIGLAVAGKVDSGRTKLTGAGNLGHWIGMPVTRALHRATGCRVVLGNDAEAAAMAEAIYGHGRTRDFWFVIWGTGVGGCLVRHFGTSGPLPMAGELGHQRITASELRCGCGQTGCLEAYCGGRGIEAMYHKRAENLSQYEWEEVAVRMAHGILNVLTVQPVPLVVFGGGVSCNQQWLLPLVYEWLSTHLKIVDVPDIVLSHFEESAGTVGALALLGL